MSLFTVIKYGNTNLSKTEELNKLPLKLLYSYYENVTGHQPSNTEFVTFTLIMKYKLNLEGIDKSRSRAQKRMHKAFLKALKEYEE